MALQEQAICVEGSAFSYHMEWTLADIPRQRLQQQMRKLQAALAGFDAVNALVGFGEKAWRLLSGDIVIDGLQSFRPIGPSSSRFAPSTQRDILIWLHGARHDENFRAAMAINSILKSDAELRLELTGFRYFDSRDLTGFVDGSANPHAEEIRTVALIAPPGPAAGGSFVMTQQWRHDLDAFNRLDIAAQEKVVGRTKVNSVELDKSAMPANSHVARNDIEHNGEAVKIYRRSAPYGTVNDNGLYFLAFSAQLARFNILLESMYGIREMGRSDRLLDFSKPLTGSYWFAPTLALLQQVID